MLLGKWIAFGLLCPVVSLLNPYGIKAILATFTVAYGNEAVPFIIEWQPFDASQAASRRRSCCSLFALLVARLRIGWAKALFVLFALHIYLTHLRFIYLFFLLVPLVIAHEIAEQYPSLSARRGSPGRATRWSSSSPAIFTRSAGDRGVAGVRGGDLHDGLSGRTGPQGSAKDALAFAEKNHLSGNVFNSYDFGGS